LERVLQELSAAIIKGESEKAEEGSRLALEQGIEPLRVISEGILSGFAEVVRNYEEGKCSFPDLMVSAFAAKQGLRHLTPTLRSRELENKRKKVVICTVEGDIHTIGKDLVSLALSAAGFQVVDLGCDVPCTQVAEAAESLNAEMIALSASLSISRLAQKKVVEILKARERRHKYKVLVGGAGTDSTWAGQIGADGWGRDVVEAVEVASRLLRD